MRFEISIPQNRRYDVVGLGLNAVDHIVVVPHFPEFNSKVRLLTHSRQTGGQVATAMVALQKLGCKTFYIGKCGGDDAGQLVLQKLAEEGIEHATIQVTNAANQIAYILIDARSGERTIVWDRDERLAFQPEEVPEEAIKSGKILHIDGHDVQADIRAAQIARSAGMPVVIDVDNYYEGADNLLPLVDFLITSAEFPHRVTGLQEPKSALVKLKQISGSYFVAMTLGKHGVLAYHNEQFIHVEGFKVDCKDTTGAGDAFRAGFIYGLLKNLEIEDTLKTANAVAAINCQAYGAQGGLPTPKELFSFLTEAGEQKLARYLEGVN
ncbi:MAG: PfkB family carbohydrate kinase [Acidobacteriota bacterium]|nr:PfkB family carbohydrate kinase [Blastocatellia bacterium]MDW8413766.1 PfkB family carbohydrate kinase [Acidobacteriota bacterium]